jgi:hypothetical protein
MARMKSDDREAAKLEVCERLGFELGIQRLVVVDGSPIWIPDRALTLCQPWAYLMTALPDDCRKDVENRRQGFASINFRGPVWIHASGQLDRKQYENAMAAARQHDVPLRYLPTWAEVIDGKRPGLARSAIVGRLTIDEYLRPTPTPDYTWHFPFNHGFLTQDASTTPVVPCPGHLGFWRITNDVAQSLARWVAGISQ